jgi:hypothetical protein
MTIRPRCGAKGVYEHVQLHHVYNCRVPGSGCLPAPCSETGFELGVDTETGRELWLEGEADAVGTHR